MLSARWRLSADERERAPRAGHHPHVRRERSLDQPERRSNRLQELRGDAWLANKSLPTYVAYVLIGPEVQYGTSEHDLATGLRERARRSTPERKRRRLDKKEKDHHESRRHHLVR